MGKYITAKEIKEQITQEQIIDIMTNCLGSNGYKMDNEGNPVFQTICHNGRGHGKYKLVYYEIDKQGNKNPSFKCYTECGDNFDIFELVQKMKDYEFGQAIEFVCEYFNIDCNNYSHKQKIGFEDDDSENMLEYWNLLNKFSDMEKYKYKNEQYKYKIIPKNILEFYNKQYPQYWIDEGISIEVMRQYDIRIDDANQKIIIPHFDIDGNLIGIRGRNYRETDLSHGFKYTPVKIEKTLYNHSLGNTLYGLDKNKKAIQKAGKIVLFEGEKSVQKCATFYGENNYTVATCGNSLTNTQRDIILNLGVSEVIIGYDKEFHNDNQEEIDRYAAQLIKIGKKFVNFCTVWILWDDGDLLEFKDSPVDKGQDVLERLLSRKQELTVSDIEEYGNGRKKTKKNR